MTPPRNPAARALSRRRFLAGAAHSAAAALLAGCVRPAHAAGGLASRPAYVDLTAALHKPPASFPQRQALPVPEPTLEAKIGQMLLVGFGGRVLLENSTLLKSVAAGRLGNVVLFGHNIIDAPQLRLLTQTLQAAAPVPLLIALDQEGGYVSRLGTWAGITPNHSAQYLGEINNLELTRTQAASTAAILRDLGVNLNLAPVVDLNTNPWNPVIGAVQRSYSSNPESVSAHAQVTIQAHREAGVGSTLKHFPGHGSSDGDTHLGFVDVTQSWSTTELAPYAKLIGAGEADAIMTAHIFNATLDAELPATLSRPVITGILREQLGFDGVIITDDMRMRAISDIYSPADAILKAVHAGVDMIAISNNIPGKQQITPDEAFTILQDHVGTGLIARARVDESYRRIMAFKAKLGLVAL